MPRKILLTTLALLGLLAAPAAAQYDFNVTPGEVVPGSSISVSGEGCAPDEPVIVTLAPADRADDATARSGDSIVLGEGVADADGRFTLQVTIPEDLEPGAYTVTMTCGDLVLSSPITVNAADEPGEGDEPESATPPATGTGDGGELSRTGSDLNRFVLVGAGLLAIGGFFLIGTRRRREAA